jgi:hypothetical protein
MPKFLKREGEEHIGINMREREFKIKYREKNELTIHLQNDKKLTRPETRKKKKVERNVFCEILSKREGTIPTNLPNFEKRNPM